MALCSLLCQWCIIIMILFPFSLLFSSVCFFVPWLCFCLSPSLFSLSPSLSLFIHLLCLSANMRAFVWIYVSFFPRHMFCCFFPAFYLSHSLSRMQLYFFKKFHLKLCRSMKISHCIWLSSARDLSLCYRIYFTPSVCVLYAFGFCPQFFLLVCLLHWILWYNVVGLVRFHSITFFLSNFLSSHSLSPHSFCNSNFCS